MKWYPNFSILQVKKLRFRENKWSRSPGIQIFLTSKSINWLLHSKKAIRFQKFCLFLFFKESPIWVLIIQLKSQSRKKYLKEPLDLLPVFIHVLSLKYQFKNLSASSNVFDFDTKSDSKTLLRLCQLSWISRDSAKPFLQCILSARATKQVYPLSNARNWLASWKTEFVNLINQLL